VNGTRNFKKATDSSGTKKAPPPRKSGVLGISRMVKSISKSMLNLVVGCLSCLEKKEIQK
jgi:hypothetical protein